MRQTIGIDASPLVRKQYTGTEWYTYNLITSLTKLPESASIDWILYANGNKPSSLILPKNWMWKELYWPFSRFWISVRLSMEMLFNNSITLFVPANRIPVITPKSTVTTIHDIGFKIYPDLYQKIERKRLNSSLKRALHKATVIFAISESTKNDLKKYISNEKRILVTKLSIDTESFEKLAKSSKRLVDYNYILFIGTLSRKKNINYLILVFEGLKKLGFDKKLIILGKEGSGAEAILRRIQESRYRDSILNIPWSTEVDKISYLSHADSLIIPSFYEGFSLPILEAQTVGVPLIISDIAVHREIASKGALFIPVDDVEVAVKKIYFFLSSKEVFKRTINDGYTNASMYSLEKTARETLAGLIKIAH